MLDSSETIAAIASRPGPAPRAIIRLSGPEALAISLGDFRDESGAHLGLPARPCVYAGQIHLTSPTLQLPAKLVLWPGPQSYTGQPVAEVHTIGSPPLVNHLLAHYLASGARLAEPGEFTLRAFLSGRIDLSQSEAVLKVIEARSPRKLQSALEQLAGGVAGPLKSLRDRLLDRLVELEANLDFVEEPDVSPIFRQGLVDDLDEAIHTLNGILNTHRGRDQADARARVVLIGKPNAGKSRLFNALLNHEHAIVSPVAGTTRDYLTAACEFDNVPLTLIDTAGEEIARDAIESAAQDKRAAQLIDADLVILCVPRDELPAFSFLDLSAHQLVITKADLSSNDLPTNALLTLSLIHI